MMKNNQTYVGGGAGGGGGAQTYSDSTSQNHRTEAILRSIHNQRTRTK